MQEQFLKDGISKTVYGLVYPETRQTLHNILSDPSFQDYFEEAYTKKQDTIHVDFFNAYVEWVKPYFHIPNQYSYIYPSAGSSEAIRETISNMNVKSATKFYYYLHMFKGEYEGYEAYARAHNISVVWHDRNNYKKTLQPYQSGLFYISQPSGIDGNFWPEFEEFIKWCNENSAVKIMLDLAYCGTTPQLFNSMTLNYDNISGIFISLSKAFGTYYYRIGGLFSREEIPGLYGNMWFKSIPALVSGTELLKKYTVVELPKKYKLIKDQVISELQTKFGTDIVSSDSLLIATQPVTKIEYNPLNIMIRGKHRRFCLTPGLDRIIKSTR